MVIVIVIITTTAIVIVTIATIIVIVEGIHGHGLFDSSNQRPRSSEYLSR